MIPNDTVPAYWFTKVPNVGDQVNPYLIEKLTGRPARLVEDPVNEPHILGIGSMMGAARNTSRVWGTGVMDPQRNIRPLPPSVIFALRGKLSVEDLRRRDIQVRDVPLGDPAVLLPRWYAPSVPKRYRVGIVPHYKDLNSPWVRSAIAADDVALINVSLPVEAFIDTLLACEVVISSSLHGLVLAEAYGLPNLWIELSNEVVGGGFKFRDWFSLCRNPQQSAATPGITVDEAIRRAALHDLMIDAEALAAALPVKAVAS